MVTSKEKIIKIAAKLFIKEGFKGCTTIELARIAGLSNNSGLFKYFRTKEDLYDTVVDRYILKPQDPQTKYCFDKDLSMLEFIDMYIKRIEMTMKYLYDELNDDNMNLTPAHYLIFIQEACRRKKKYKKRYYTQTLLNGEMWEQVFQKAIDSGEIKPDTNIEFYADLYHTLFFGASFLHAAIYDGLQPEKLKKQYYHLYNIIKKD
ncbi:MAG: TetR/AcrR family transcriptional regulator [Prevotellaceae bacterium]|jgi:AcrR family transcriptional regulator|nr:TetR/AcrR family transcriptional regulator [Prevotellaceae bacterium]